MWSKTIASFWVYIWGYQLDVRVGSLLGCLQQVIRYLYYRRENQLCIRQNFCFREKISRMPSAEMEDFVEHTPRKALKILRRL